MTFSKIFHPTKKKQKNIFINWQIILLIAMTTFSANLALAQDENNKSLPTTSQELSAALIQLKSEFEKVSTEINDLETITVSALKTSAEAWALCAGYLGRKKGFDELAKQIEKQYISFVNNWSEKKSYEEKILATSKLYYNAISLTTEIFIKTKSNAQYLEHLNNIRIATNKELETSSDPQRQSTIYTNSISLDILPLLIKIENNPQSKEMLIKETEKSLMEIKNIISRTDVHIHGKLFILYKLSLNSLLRTTFILSESNNLNLKNEIFSVQENWRQLIDNDKQSLSSNVAVTASALAITNLLITYGLAFN